MKVVVLGGGRSPEHEVSLRGASAVADGLRRQGHEAVLVRLETDGRWTLGGEPLAVTPGGGLLGADCVFPVLHGPGGEDGAVQGMLELLDVPYVGSGVLSSALNLDKLAFKDSIRATGLPQVDYVAVSADRWRREPEAVVLEASSLAKPWWVKAACGGSSIGMEPITTEGELPAAIERCLQLDSRVIIEAAATGVEVECAVLGGAPGEVRISQPGEIEVTGGGWYDHEAKYTPGGMSLIVPARIPDELRDEVHRICLAAFRHTDCHGLARIDCFVDADAGTVLLNEINTLPGFTATSVYSRLWEESGLGYGELLGALLATALARPRRLSVA